MRFTISPKHFLLALSAAVLLSACDNPVDSDGDEHLDEPTGVQITDLGGTVLATSDGDNWDFPRAASALTVPLGGDLDVRIYFVSDDGDRFQLPPEGDEHTLRVASANASIVTYQAGATEGQFVGVSTGQTTVVIQAFHGGHPDYESPALPIRVN